MAEWEITDGHRASSSGLVILSEAKQLQLTVAFVEAWSIFLRPVIANAKGNARKNRGCLYSGALRRKHLETSEKKKKHDGSFHGKSLGQPRQRRKFNGEVPRCSFHQSLPLPFKNFLFCFSFSRLVFFNGFWDPDENFTDFLGPRLSPYGC